MLEHIEPVHLDELVNAFGKDNTWVVLGSEIGADAQPLKFEWIKDIIDKCIELGIPLKMEYNIKGLVEENGYEFVVQEPKPMRETKEIRRNNLAIKNAGKTDQYNLKLEGLKRNAENYVAAVKQDSVAFVTFGNVSATECNAARLLHKSPAFDIILTAESKGIPLAYEMSKQSGRSYIVARRNAKHHTNDKKQISVDSENALKFYLDEEDFEEMKGKRVLLVDAVVNTGESLKALEALVKAAGGTSAAKVAVFAAKTAANRNDIIFLQQLADTYK